PPDGEPRGERPVVGRGLRHERAPGEGPRPPPVGAPVDDRRPRPAPPRPPRPLRARRLRGRRRADRRAGPRTSLRLDGTGRLTGPENGRSRAAGLPASSEDLTLRLPQEGSQSTNSMSTVVSSFTAAARVTARID